MSEDDDKVARHRALLRKSYDALEAEQSAAEADPGPEPERRRKEDAESGNGVVMYRGKPVKKGRGLATPGAGSTAQRGRQFRGSPVKSGPGSNKGGGDDSVKEALKKLADLHKEGLITKAEYDRKKKQLLDRL